ncbi:MAG: glycosyltransferase [Actinomycetota bacterium]|nr:glycosyltransferase [Actinomycetota bacterium]
MEPHTVHGRLKEFEENFIYQLCEDSDVVLFKCDYQKWRLNWTFTQKGWEMPNNIMIVPHGARVDRRWGEKGIQKLRKELKLDKIKYLSNNIVGLIGWIQSNKRWDILTSIWEEVSREIKKRTGEDWDLLAAGTMRDEAHREDFKQYKESLEILEKKGIAHYYEFIPRGDIYYKVIALSKFVVLPTVDETQSGTLARIVALKKPYITTAPLEGLTAQTLDSEGGLLFTNKKMLKEKVIRLACDGNLRRELSKNLKNYLKKNVSWGVVTRKYRRAYRFARLKKIKGEEINFPPDF